MADTKGIKPKAKTDVAMIQLKIDCKNPSPCNELSLTVAIADLIHSCGLPFAITDEPKLARVINLLRGVASTYKPLPTKTWPIDS